MSHQAAHRRGRRARIDRWGLIRIGSLLMVVVPLLSGCMEALQTGQRPVGSAPAPLPTVSATRAPNDAPLPSPTALGSLAPDPATAAPTVPQPTPPGLPVATAAPAPTGLPPLALPTVAGVTNEQRWRSQQQNRQPFAGLLAFTTAGSELWWFDPVNQQHVILGRISGPFVAQASFTPLGQGVEALEIPYQVNVSYGLTALSPALLARIAAAGYESDWIETYVFLTPDVMPQ